MENNIENLSQNEVNEVILPENETNNYDVDTTQEIPKKNKFPKKIIALLVVAVTVIICAVVGFKINSAKYYPGTKVPNLGYYVDNSHLYKEKYTATLTCASFTFFINKSQSISLWFTILSTSKCNRNPGART